MRSARHRFWHLLHDYVAIALGAMISVLLALPIVEGNPVEVALSILAIFIWAIVYMSYLTRKCFNPSAIERASIRDSRERGFGRHSLIHPGSDSSTALKKGFGLTASNSFEGDVSFNFGCQSIGRPEESTPTSKRERETPMNQLTVQNGVLRFLGEVINIAHIVNQRVVYIKRRPPKLPPKLVIILTAIAVAAGGVVWLSFFGGLSLHMNHSDLELIGQAAALLLIVVSGALLILIGSRLRVLMLNTFGSRFGLCLRLTTGEGRVFISKDRQQVLDVADAIEQAMNSPGTTIVNNFQGDFRIESADNVNFGAQIR